MTDEIKGKKTAKGAKTEQAAKTEQTGKAAAAKATGKAGAKGAKADQAKPAADKAGAKGAKGEKKAAQPAQGEAAGKELVPQSQQQSALALGITASADINMTDMIAVAVAECEAIAGKKLAEANDLRKALEKQKAEACENLKKAICALVDSKFAKEAREMETFLSQFGPIKVKLSGDLDKKDGKLVVIACISLNDRGKVELEVTEEIQSLYDQTKALDEEIAKATEEGIKWRKKLTKAPEMERQFRAQFVKGQLSTNEAGQAILDNLGAHVSRILDMF